MLWFNLLMLQMGKLRFRGWECWGNNRSGARTGSGILGQATAPLHLASPREISQFPTERAWSGSVEDSVSRADWGESDYVDRLVIRKECSSPLNAFKYRLFHWVSED